MKKLVCLAGIACFLISAEVVAQDAFAAKKLELYGNFETMSIYLPYEGDANGNARAAVRFRKADAGEWQDAQPLVRIRGNRLAGCLFGLASGTEYEVKVAVTEPDAAKPIEVTATGKTRTDKFPAATGKSIYVAPNGRDDAAGTKEQPFAAIQHGLDRAEAGDVVTVMPGVYHESLRIAKSGRPDAYITLRGMKGAVLTGADPRFEKKGNGLWSKVRDDIYSTKPDVRVRYVAEDGKRLYFWKSLEDLEKGFEERRGKRYDVKGGWAFDPATKMLYVMLPDGGDPNGRSLQVARFDRGIAVQGASFVIVEGLDVGFFGNWLIHVRGGSDVVIRNNVLHNVRNGVRIDGKGTGRTLVEGNTLYETSVWEWPWQMCKAHDPEGSAIFYTAGRGNVCRKNTIRGFFNGVVPSMWGRLEEEGWNTDLDVHDNVMTKIGDDGLEPEGTCVNQRYFRNRIEDALVGLSLAPITTGPVYAVRNVMLNHHLTAVKLSNDSSGPVMLFHNTFVTTVTDTDHYRTRKAVNGIGHSGPYHALMFRNNIIVATDYVYCDWLRDAGPQRFHMDYDALFTTSEKHFVMFRAKRFADVVAFRDATGYEAHGMGVDPKFVDLAKGDVRLTSDSPIIDRGVRLPNINDGFRGKGPDLGALEQR